MSYEFPLVFFTLLSQLGVGLALVGLCKTIRQKETDLKKFWFWTLIISILGMIASLFHLSHPFEALSALKALGTAWLSREVLIYGIFIVLLIVNWRVRSTALAAVTAFCGLLFLFMQGETYAPVSMPAIHNIIPMLIFVLTALIFGICCGTAINDNTLIFSEKILLALFLLILIAAPSIWLSGNTTMKLTATMWLHSPLFWIGLILTAIALAMLFYGRKHLFILRFSILCGAFLLRIAFFADTASTAATIGMPY